MLKSTSFIFDGVPSDTYGLMIYFLDDESTKELPLGTDVDMIEDRLPKNISPFSSIGSKIITLAPLALMRFITP